MIRTSTADVETKTAKSTPLIAHVVTGATSLIEFGAAKPSTTCTFTIAHGGVDGHDRDGQLLPFLRALRTAAHPARIAVRWPDQATVVNAEVRITGFGDHCRAGTFAHVVEFSGTYFFAPGAATIIEEVVAGALPERVEVVITALDVIAPRVVPERRLDRATPIPLAELNELQLKGQIREVNLNPAEPYHIDRLESVDDVVEYNNRVWRAPNPMKVTPSDLTTGRTRSLGGGAKVKAKRKRTPVRGIKARWDDDERPISRLRGPRIYGLSVAHRERMSQREIRATLCRAARLLRYCTSDHDAQAAIDGMAAGNPEAMRAGEMRQPAGGGKEVVAYGLTSADIATLHLWRGAARAACAVRATILLAEDARRTG